MKKIITLSLASILCLTMAACGSMIITEQASPEIHTETGLPESPVPVQQENAVVSEEPEIPVPQSIQLAGPWRLDREKNDLAAFADSLDLFPGYGEWGAGMELRSDGRMNWFIGAEGWHGTYSVEGNVLHAQLISDLEQHEQGWDFRIVVEKETTVLEMPYGDRTIYWRYGDQEDGAYGNEG